MTLYQFLSINQIEKAQFARDLGIAESTLFKYINQEREPRLVIAIRIVEYTKGKVTYRGLLKDEDDSTFKPPKPLKTKKVELIDTDLL